MTATSTLLRRSEKVETTAFRRGAIGILVFAVAWELATRLHEWIGIRVPLVGQLPPPSAVVADFLKLAGSQGYWNSWSLSFQRVLVGFAVALAIGGTLGLLIPNPSVVQADGVSGIRIFAADPAARLGADRDYLLADPGTVHHVVGDFPLRAVPDRIEYRRRRQSRLTVATCLPRSRWARAGRISSGTWYCPRCCRRW